MTSAVPPSMSQVRMPSLMVPALAGAASKAVMSDAARTEAVLLIIGVLQRFRVKCRGPGSGSPGAGQPVHGGLVVRVQPHGLLVRFRCLGLVAAPLVDQRLVGPALGDLAVELDRRVEVGEGVVLVV